MTEERTAAEKMAIRDSMEVQDGKFQCDVCGKVYQKKGFCANHIYEVHRGIIRADVERIEKEQEKRSEQWEKDYACRQADDYFDNLLSSIDDLKRDVERYKKGFENARDRKSYSGSGKPIDLSNMAHEVEWCVHHVTRNFTNHSDKGVRACMKLTKAFDLEI
jgi:predicted transcriptional regulator